MNKLLAKIKLNNNENFGLLIRTFFENFNSENSLNLKDNVADLELLFEVPPKEIIEALSNYEILELNLTKMNSTTEVLEVQKEEVKSKSKEIKSIKKDDAISKSKSKNLTYVDIPKLEELAKVSTSYEDFAYKIAEWLKMDSKIQKFVDITLVCENLENFTWKSIEKALNDKNIKLPEWEKTYIGRKIKENIDNILITPLILFYSIQKYREYSFASTTNNLSDNTSDTSKSNTSMVLTAKQNIKLKSMPKIKEFDLILENIDKTKPIKDRISYVLTPIGLTTLSEELQNQIIELAYTALKKKNVYSDNVFDSSKIPEDKILIVRMSFSRLLNNYIHKYDTNKNIILLDFISDLQPVIMNIDEIS